MKKLPVLILMTALFCVNLIAQNNGDNVARPTKSYRFTLGSGYAYRLGKMEKTGDKVTDDLAKKLRHGFDLNASGQLFFNRNIGIGINAIYIRQHESGPERVIPMLTGFTSLELKETTQFFYLGPSFVVSSNPNKIVYYAEAGAGLLVFDDAGDIYGIKFDLTRPTVGFHLGVSPEYRFSSQFGLGLKLSLTAGFIYTSFYGTDEKLRNVSNLNIGAFISFRTK